MSLDRGGARVACRRSGFPNAMNRVWGPGLSSAAAHGISPQPGSAERDQPQRPPSGRANVPALSVFMEHGSAPLIMFLAQSGKSQGSGDRVPGRLMLAHSGSGSTTLQTFPPQSLHLPRRTRSSPIISAVSRTIVTDPRHRPHQTLSRAFSLAHRGILSHRCAASGANKSMGQVGFIIWPVHSIGTIAERYPVRQFVASFRQVSSSSSGSVSLSSRGIVVAKSPSMSIPSETTGELLVVLEHQNSSFIPAIH